VSWVKGTPTEEENAAFKVGKGHLTLADRLDTLIPPHPFELFDLEEEEANDISVVRARAQEAPLEPHTPSPLLRLLASCTELDFAVTEDNVPATVRVSAFGKENLKERSLVVHLVNYSIPVHAEASSGPPAVVRELALDLPLPEGWQAVCVEGLEPGRETAILPFSQEKSRLTVTAPELAVYKVLHIHCGWP
jgi:hypothetical protein